MNHADAVEFVYGLDIPDLDRPDTWTYRGGRPLTDEEQQLAVSLPPEVYEDALALAALDVDHAAKRYWYACAEGFVPDDVRFGYGDAHG